MDRRSLVSLVSAILLLLFLVPWGCTSYVEPDEIGVRQSLLSGIAKKDFGQGRVVDIPFVHTMHMVPSTL